MGVSKKWMKIIRKKLLASSNRYTSIPRLSTSTICSNESDNACMGNETSTSEDQGLPVSTKGEVAAMKIQACFRGHLARRAYRALRSLVKVQALVRGVLVRRQSRMALHCMHVLVRLQVRIRARQFLGGSLAN